MKRVSVPLLVFVGLLALAYFAGRRGFGSGVASEVRASVRKGGPQE